MDNDALMRRISAATNLKKAATSAGSSTPAPTPNRPVHAQPIMRESKPITPMQPTVAAPMAPVAPRLQL